jgi:hypothetical protein
MKRAYLYVPLVLISGFGGYYVYWESHAEERAEDRRLQAIEDSFGAKLYRDRDGKKEAEEDIARGTPKLKEYGLMYPDVLVFRSILHERFGVQAEVIAGCEVSEPLIKYAHAYNATVNAFIAKKYGQGALEALREEARQISYQKYTRANQALEPTSTAVTPPADAGDRASGTRGSP